MDISKVVVGIPTAGVKLALAPALIVQDRILRLTTLPNFIVELAEGLHAAGAEAQAAGDKLVGAGPNPGVRGTLASSAESIAGIVESLEKGVKLLSDATDGIAKVPRMGGPAGRLREAGKPIAESTAHLGGLAGSMTELAETLTSVGESLERLGDHLHQIGDQAQALVGGIRE